MSTFLIILCITGYIVAGLLTSKFIAKSMYLDSSDPTDCIQLTISVTIIIIIWPLLCIMYLIGRVFFNIIKQ